MVKKARVKSTSVTNVSFEKETILYQKEKADFVIGVDEVGRGCLAGPVVTCALFLPLHCMSDLKKIQDSKTLDEKTRENVYHQLTACSSLVFETAERVPEEIDATDILTCTMDAMATAVLGLLEKLPKLNPQKKKLKCHILIDGNRIPPQLSLTNTLIVGDQNILLKYEAIVKGDASIFSIAAASIIAKVTRDRQLNMLAFEFPTYFFERHKGYATSEHIQAIQKCGILSIHRLTFRPVCDFLLANDDLWPVDRERVVVDPVQRRQRKLSDKLKSKQSHQTLESFGFV